MQYATSILPVYYQYTVLLIFRHYINSNHSVITSLVMPGVLHHYLHADLLVGNVDSEDSLLEHGSGHRDASGGVGEHNAEVKHVHLGEETGSNLNSFNGFSK